MCDNKSFLEIIIVHVELIKRSLYRGTAVTRFSKIGSSLKKPKIN